MLQILIPSDAFKLGANLGVVIVVVELVANLDAIIVAFKLATNLVIANFTRLALQKVWFILCLVRK